MTLSNPELEGSRLPHRFAENIGAASSGAQDGELVTVRVDAGGNPATYQWDASGSTWRRVGHVATLVGSASSDGLSTTTSSSFSTKATLAVTGLEAGSYALRWYAELAQSSALSSTEMRVTRQTGALASILALPRTVVPTYEGEGGQAIFNLAAGDHTFRIAWRSVAGTGTASIRRARLSLERMS